jgi:hypothetical protein
VLKAWPARTTSEGWQGARRGVTDLERRAVVTIIWITEEDRRRAAEVRRERIERDELMTLFCRWLLARAGHDGPVTVPELTPETEARLLSLLRQGRP